MAKKPYFSEREVRLARSFIKATGGNEKNGYLLLAVIAWQRAMTKNHETFWKSLSRFTAFRAGQLLAAKLKQKIGLDGKHYKGILASLRRAGQATGYVDQAKDFLTAIRQSSWDRKHYGYIAPVEGHWEYKWEYGRGQVSYWVPEQPEYDPLAVIWAKLTGHNIPKKYFIDTIMPVQPKPKPEPPRQPRSLIHVLPQPDYLQPYAARTFYAQRDHLGSNILPE